MFGWIFILLGLGVIALAIWLRQRSVQAQYWPGVEGEIIRSEFEEDPHDSDKSLRIRYQYIVDGKRYESVCVSYAGFATDMTTAQRYLDKYPLGASVTVYFDPGKPEAAVLENGTSGIWIGLIMTGLIMIGVGCAIEL